ncbi:MAG: hypothetical protein VCE75_15750, partial [Alphaproteobacteria bacterium]
RLEYAALGTLIGLYMLLGLMIALPGGVLGRGFGETRMCFLGLALMTLGGSLMGLAETYVLATIGRVIAGVGGVIINIFLTKMVADWFAGPEMMAAMALFVNSWPVGIGLGLLTLGPFASMFRLGFTGRELALVLLAGTLWSLFNVSFILVASFVPDILTAAGHSQTDAGAVVSIES